VSLKLSSQMASAMHTGGLLSKTGVSRPLDATSDGMVRNPHHPQCLRALIWSNTHHPQCLIALIWGAQVWGEAGGAVVLHTVSDDTSTYSRLIGTATTCTSTALPLQFADPLQMQVAASIAFEVAGIVAEDTSFTHMHSMGNKASDVPEVPLISTRIMAILMSIPLSSYTSCMILLFTNPIGSSVGMR
jgi:hypothetical protein